jgi:hypothetical protein
MARRWAALRVGWRGLGLAVAGVRELTGTGTPVGPWLAELLHHPRAWLTRRIAELRETMRRVDQFEGVGGGDRGGRQVLQVVTDGGGVVGRPDRGEVAVGPDKGDGAAVP